MRHEKDSVDKKESENINKGKKKGFIKKIGITTLCLMAVSAVGVYAWFSVSNKAKVEKLSLIADHQGNLQIAPDLGNGPGTYASSLELTDTVGAILSPVTTKDGIKFYSPSYDSQSSAVVGVNEITDHHQLTKFYIYEKSFYLKAGSNKSNDGVATIKRTYDIAFYGIASNNRDEGCRIYQATNGTETAANAVRISFTLEDGTSYVYEPNSNVHNTDTSRAQNGLDSSYGSYPKLYQQLGNGTFAVSPKENESEKLFNIGENQDVKVTMRIWIEGTDDDCTNSIESDNIVGQIQFVSTEIKTEN